MKLRIAIATLMTAIAPTLYAQDIRIAHIYSRTGPLESYGVQTQTGLMMGLEYATGGTMTIAGHKLVVVERDDQGKPDVGKTLLASAFSDDRADIAVGPVSSSVALAMLPVAEEYKKVLLVDAANADAITGERWNKYIFRTGRNSSQDAAASAAAFDKPDVYIGTLVQDNAFGRDSVKAFKDALKNAKVVHEEYLPFDTTDFTAGAQRLFDALKDKPGRKVILITWAGTAAPFQIVNLNPKRFGIELAGIGNTLEVMKAYTSLPGMEGAAYYYYGIPKNPTNDWLVSEHRKRFKAPPDLFTAIGMSAGIALVEALKKTGGDPGADKLIAAMEGMSFNTPKGKMTFRKEDHQAMQSMYHFRIRNDPTLAWGVPELVREIKPEEMNIPIRNKR